MVNAFQQGQQFALEQDKRQRVEKGVNALADQFGPQALAPQEFSTVRGVEQRDKAFEASQEQRTILNKRADVTAANVEEDRTRTEQVRTGQAVVQFYKQGLASGVPVEEIAARAGPALEALGVDPAQQQQLNALIQENPEILGQLEAGLRGATATTRRVVGKPTPIRNPDGTTALLQQFSDGTTEVVGGVTPLTQELQAGRLGVAQQRADIAGETIDPDAAGRLAGAKKAEQLTAERVDEGLTEARTAAIAVENADRALALLEDEGVIAGAAGEFRQVAFKYFQDILGIPNEKVADTDEFFARMGIEVAGMIQAFGAGTGLSDADREFAKNIVGGNQALDPEAIRRLVKMRQGISKKTISNYNRDRDAFVKRLPNLSEAFPRIDVPGEGRILTFNPETGLLE